MKSPGTVYRKYKQLKKLFILQELQDALKKDFSNCSFCKNLYCFDKNGNKKTIYICTFQEDKKEISTLNELKNCENPKKCNSFSYKNSKETIKNSIENKFKDKEYIKKNYPELYLLEWVLDYETNKFRKKLSPLAFIILKIIDFLNYILKYL